MEAPFDGRADPRRPAAVPEPAARNVMPNPHGSFIWYELMTTDTTAAGRFYADVVGWSVSGFGSAGSAYQVFSAGDTGVAGMMPIPQGAEQSGVRPGWF